MTYAGLTTADKGALLDAKARGDNWAARDSSERLMTYPSKPFKMLHGIDIWAFDNEEGEHAHEIDYTPLTFIQWSDAEPVNIDLALAQIAVMESKQTTNYCRVGDATVEVGVTTSPPLTWNERINQMTVEEKARWMLNRGTEMHNESAKYAWDNASRKFEEMYIQRMIEFLASPYTEGETA